MAQHLYRDLNAEHDISDTKTRNEIQLATRTRRGANTYTEISMLNTTAVSQEQRIRYSWQQGPGGLTPIQRSQR